MGLLGKYINTLTGEILEITEAIALCVCWSVTPK